MWWMNAVEAAEPVVDGDLAEWKEAPRWKLGADSQVAGASKVKNPADFSAKVWVRFTPLGMYVAGDVTDDRVMTPEKATDINTDHPEIWLSLPRVAFPEIGFGNQFGQVEIGTPEECDNETIGLEDATACKAWRQTQVRHRRKLDRMFTRQWAVFPQVQELWAVDGGAEVPNVSGLGSSKSILVEHGQGYRFEAFFALDAFPATTGTEIREVSVLVDFVDNDEGTDKQESFLSSAKGRKFGDPSTFDHWKLPTPIAFGSAEAGPLTAALIGSFAGISNAKPDNAGLFPQMVRFPAQPLDGFLFINEPIGYQYQPTEPSPSVIPVDLRPKRLATFGELTIELGPASSSLFTTNFLYTRKGDQIVDIQPLGRDTPAKGGMVGKVWRGIFRDEGTQSALGTGACGACSVDYVGIADVTAEGKIAVQYLEFAYDRSFSEGGYFEDVVFAVANDLSSISWTGMFDKIGEGGDSTVLPVTETWGPGPDGEWVFRGAPVK